MGCLPRQGPQHLLLSLPGVLPSFLTWVVQTSDQVWSPQEGLPNAQFSANLSGGSFVLYHQISKFCCLQGTYHNLKLLVISSLVYCDY